MGQLNAGNRALGVHETGDAGQWFDMPVAPNPHVAGRDPPVAGDGRCLDHHQGHPAGRSAAKMHQVPIAGHPLLGDVLAHGRHHDPVAEGDAPNRQRAEQIDLRHFPVVVRSGTAAVGS